MQSYTSNAAKVGRMVDGASAEILPRLIFPRRGGGLP